ncbi:hypothetical protein EDD80_106178 [Anseongella ginsenosidimutans]|uniref:Uncharacterized protein n=1 Tax=Anseongella ginsenosidimutans TaxID=496056 RepID=A0A4R3KQK5_9SPHI|nr:hypothetical protein [Anseongella ginsenosidimutans]QEC52306.1 hypothetical protein FRZ59_08130 [Anseongella ginsenosidimutans]TCS86867.1 hypothetical protein EDD80_106178 [Anseongella ginsenosidimutans]
MKHSYHILVEIILIFLLVILFFQYRQIRKERNALRASKQGLDFELKLRSDSMAEMEGKHTYLNNLSDSLFNDSDIRYFKQRGLNNPERDLLNSLYQQHDLIPEQGVLGGNMRIWHATLLGRNWALAYFEDGHIAGNMLLKYTVNEGDVQWEVIDSSTNGQ